MKKRLVLMYVAVTNLGNYIIEPKDMKIYRRKKKTQLKLTRHDHEMKKKKNIDETHEA
jgi:hypothetical protein